MHRALLNNWILTCADADYLRLWVQLLLNAAYKETTKFYNGRLVNLMPGEVLFTRNHWAKQTHVSEGKIRSMMDAFEKDRMITQRSVGNAYTIVFITNWCAYQSEGVVYQSDDDRPAKQSMEQPIDKPPNRRHQQLQQLSFSDFETTRTTSGTTDQTANGPTSETPTIYKNIKNIRNSRKNIYSLLIDNFTHHTDLKNALCGFIEMRFEIKKPLTERAFQSILNKLKSLAADSSTQIAILDRSIENCWQGIFDLPKEEVRNHARNGSGYDKTKILHSGAAKDYKDLSI